MGRAGAKLLGAVSTIRSGAPKRALRFALTTASAVALIYIIVVLSTYAARGNEQIVWMLKGKMEFRLGSEQRVCGQGDVIVIP